MDRDALSMLVAHNIQKAMDHRGLNAFEVARQAHLNPTGVYDILTGRTRSPRVDTLAKIAEVLGVPIVSLLEEQDLSALRRDLLAALEVLSPDDRERLLLTARAWSPKA